MSYRWRERCAIALADEDGRAAEEVRGPEDRAKVLTPSVTSAPQGE